ncbi:hypothetical protein L3Q82_020175 [Scortum barcoo]|uniref:Uncharacterized protein n=1 Tax=Scortum barcoo TaxID=214431 RepID=A0ACB8VB67_9TELE|nr:hypothetical protein L3Q82_020175 [Scortum barcoo]
MGVCPTSPHVLCGSGEGIRPCPSCGILWGVLREYGVRGPLLRAVRSLYDRSRSLVRIAGSKSDLFPVHVGLRQGCPLSPVLFIIFMTDRISRHSQGPEGVQFGNHRISSPAFCRRCFPVGFIKPEPSARIVLERFAAECEAAGMRISTSKSEAMVLDDRKRVACPLRVGGEVLPQVEELKYLGVLFTSEGKMEREIDRRIGAASAVMRNTTTPPSSSPTSTQSSPLITTDQVRGQLRKLRPRKAAGPDKVCPRLLKTCAAELGEPLQRIFNLSLQIGRVPTLWKTSRIVPVPKKNRPSELNDFRPVALTSHLMKTLERLFLSLLRPQVQHAQDRLQFAYQPGVGVEDAILYLLHRAHSHLDKGSGTVRILFLDFSSAFNTIQTTLLWDKLSRMGVDPQLMDWISDYLTGRPQYVGLKDITSDTVVSSTGAPQGTVLAPLLFTLYTSDFCYNSELCHIQKYADDTAIIGCIRDDREEEYQETGRGLRCMVPH